MDRNSITKVLMERDGMCHDLASDVVDYVMGIVQQQIDDGKFKEAELIFMLEFNLELTDFIDCIFL